MNASLTFKPSLYDALLALPKGLTGEILQGRLYSHPRPSWAHGLAGSRLGADIEGPYGRGRGGPGGWWIIDEPEVHLILDREVVVPDIAGWRKEHLPLPPQGHKVQVVPDWVCEILSASTSKTDRDVKMPLYAQFGVQYAWLVDPAAHRLEAYDLIDSKWRLLALFRADDRVSIAPFDSIQIRLEELWG
ncbi:MAG: Uma2 family endonuclease [Methylococcales bacterium]